MRVSGDWLSHPGTQALCAALEAAGYQALLVGGCVRNALLGMPVSDIDLCTDAEPQIVSDIAQKASFKVVPTGIEHGTLTIIARDCVHEVTTFRRDVSTDGRRASVAFSTDIAEDAARRDLTMNALYARADGTVIDPLGGLPDLIARRVRFVGDPDARIREDYLRILRFFRFHAHFADPSGGMDGEALAACAANLDGLAGLSRERVGQEFRKLLSAPDPAPAVSAMAASGVLTALLPGSDPRALAPLVHLEGDLAPDWRRRLVVLCGEGLAEALKLSRSEARDLAALGQAIATLDCPAALGFLLKADLGASAVLARAAILGGPLPPHWAYDVARGAHSRFPVTARDLPYLSGLALGNRLKELQKLWLATGLVAEKGDLLASAPPRSLPE
jgi:poly(A) polymerase